MPGLPARLGVEERLDGDREGRTAFMQRVEYGLLVGGFKVGKRVMVIGEPEAALVACAACALVLCLCAVLVGNGEDGTA